MRLVEKEITDKFWNIIRRHGNRMWAIDELEWLIDVNYFNFTNDKDLKRAYEVIRILRNY